MSVTVRVTIGPKNPTFGSWNWVGEHLLRALTMPFRTEYFDHHHKIQNTDIVVFIKFLPELSELQQLAENAILVYVPIDRYGSAAEIDDDRPKLQVCHSVLSHSRRLCRYMQPYVQAVYLEHPLCFALQQPRPWISSGPLVWIGRSCNLPPVVTWVNNHSIPIPIILATEVEDQFLCPRTYGFMGHNDVTMVPWSREVHLKLTELALAAIDVKGNDFRARHKPPAKMLDFLASGVPVMTNRGSSADLFAHENELLVLRAENWFEDWTDLNSMQLRRQAFALQEALSPDRVSEYCQHYFLNLLQTRESRNDPSNRV
jgi:hypothetical protein